MVARYTKMREPCVVWPGAVRAIIRLSVALALACGGGAMAAAPDDLYRAQAIVTGQGEANRLIEQEAISLNDQKVSNVKADLDLAQPGTFILKVGKRRFLKLVVVKGS